MQRRRATGAGAGARGCGPHPSRAGDRTLNPGSRMPVETPSQRDPAAAHEERSVVIFPGSVSIKLGEL